MSCCHACYMLSCISFVLPENAIYEAHTAHRPNCNSTTSSPNPVTKSSHRICEFDCYAGNFNGRCITVSLSNPVHVNTRASFYDLSALPLRLSGMSCFRWVQGRSLMKRQGESCVSMCFKILHCRLIRYSMTQFDRKMCKMHECNRKVGLSSFRVYANFERLIGAHKHALSRRYDLGLMSV